MIKCLISATMGPTQRLGEFQDVMQPCCHHSKDSLLIANSMNHLLSLLLHAGSPQHGAEVQSPLAIAHSDHVMRRLQQSRQAQVAHQGVAVLVLVHPAPGRPWSCDDASRTGIAQVRHACQEDMHPHTSPTLWLVSSIHDVIASVLHYHTATVHDYCSWFLHCLMDPCSRYEYMILVIVGPWCKQMWCS